MVLAGPGSGKTLVLTHHIKYLIESGVNPTKILVITFTRQAAKEMKGRFKNLMPLAANKVVFGTFHSVFYRMLKIFNEDLPCIIDNNKRTELLQKIKERYDSLEDVSDKISKYKSTTEKEKLFFYSEKDKEDFYRCLNEYTCLLEQNKYMDYDDIIDFFHRMICDDFRAFKMIKEQFEYVCIDEFQDINDIQYGCIKMLFSNVFAVGDEDQSIYGFRGSKPEIMHTFVDDYNPAIYELVCNFRSFDSIIQGANTVIEKNQGRIKKNVQICNKKDTNNHFHVLSYESREAETEAIVNDVEKLLNANRRTAVLLRTNKDVNLYREMLLNRSLKREESVIKNEIIYSVIDYINYATDKDINSLKRILNVPKRDIPESIFIHGDRSIELLAQRFNGSSKGQRLFELSKQLSVLSKFNPYSCVMYLRNVIGLESYFAEKYGKKYKPVINNIFEEIINIAKDNREYDSVKQRLNGFITENTEGEEFDKKDNLIITTYHQSKGLEYDCVLLPDVCEGKIPDSLSIMECNIEEERRLFYVAITRAREELYIYTICNEKNNTILPSRFISDFLF